MEKISYYDPDEVIRIETPHRLLDPEHYLPPAGLIDAANVAILLGQPLLLTGEPGTGKTRFAYHLAHALKLSEPWVFEAKSTSAARDVFYTYDYLNDFRDAHRDKEQPPGRYITINALGAAILCSKPRLDKDVDLLWPGESSLSGKPFPGPKRSVVLLDEIDKAPRDFPNDILNELELMYFKVAECGNRRVAADPKLRPIVVLTSNSEKQLPDAFLRRCVFFDIPFPTGEELERIVAARLAEFNEGDVLLRDAIDLFELIRAQSTIRKKPGTAELIGWVSVLRALKIPMKARLRDHRDPLNKSLGALAKTREDQATLHEEIDKWISAPPNPTNRR